MTEAGADVGPLAEVAERLRLEGATAMFVALDGRAIGLIAVADPIKDTSLAAIRALQAVGVRVVMATGDGLATARAVAQQLAIDEVHGDVRPQDKAELVRGSKRCRSRPRPAVARAAS